MPDRRSYEIRIQGSWHLGLASIVAVAPASRAARMSRTVAVLGDAGADLKLPPVPGLDFGEVRRVERMCDGQHLGGEAACDRDGGGDHGGYRQVAGRRRVISTPMRVIAPIAPIAHGDGVDPGQGCGRA